MISLMMTAPNRGSAPATRKKRTLNSFTPRFMESVLSLWRMHWDHEPTPSPSQEGNGQDADRCLFPSWEGLGVGRFMERAIQFPKGTSAANRARRVLLMSARFVVPFLICQLVCTARIAAAETAAHTNDYS